MQFPSKLLENAVNEISRLPGIGKKTALRLVLHILKEETAVTVALSDSLIKLRQEIQYCQQCYNISDGPNCNICTSHRRDPKLICVVEDIRDVMAIENTAQFQGHYHVLGGIISPIEGIGPSDLQIESLINRVNASDPAIAEVILALSPTMEGDTTSFYLTKKLNEFDLKVTTLARGVPIGGELEYADEITLGRSIVSRRIYEAN